MARLEIVAAAIKILIFAEQCPNLFCASARLCHRSTGDKIVTRINLIAPSELTRQHLVAEYRELPRIFGLARRAIARGERPDGIRNPTHYVLGPGHCRFFYPRLRFLVRRHEALIREMRKRGYQTTYTGFSLFDFPGEWRGDYVPTADAVNLNRQRIRERSQ